LLIALTVRDLEPPYCAPHGRWMRLSWCVQISSFWSIGAVKAAAFLQTAQEHALTCTATPSVTCFGTGLSSISWSSLVR
jgi:hypothetical protein